jgi:predicted Ser/Thr protein kinase
MTSNVNPPAKLSAADLDDAGWRILADAIARLEQSWQAAGEADLGPLLPAGTGPLRELVLVELIKVDQEYRGRAGRLKPLEAYLEEWPELRHRPESLAELRQAEALNQAVVPGGKETSRDGSADTLAEPGPAAPGPPHKRLGRYEILAELGHGGMGTVYRAFDTQLEREVALKIPNCDPAGERAVVERFLQEGKAAARIQHPNVCPIYDAGQYGTTYFLVMALIDGQPLTQQMQQHPPTPAEAAELVRKLAAALQVIHDQGIVHRDIKPSNIMVTRQGEPLLMDFGLARRLDGAGGHTASGLLVGTVPYMSPEQINGEPADRRSDVYSLGVVFYQLLAGQLPFQGKLTDLLLRIGHDEPARPSALRPGLDPELEAICLKAMAKAAGERFASAGDLATALQAWQSHPGIRPAQAGRRQAASRWIWLSSLSALLLLAVAAAVLILPRNEPVPRKEPPQPRGMAAAPELAFEFHLQRQQEIRGDYQQLSAEAFPLRDGDRFQLFVNLAREAFVYVYWFDHAGSPTRLYPPQLAEQRKSRGVTVPAGAGPGADAKWRELRDMRGAETVFVGASDTPRTEEQLRELEAAFRVPSPAVHGQRLLAFAYPAEKLKAERGVGEVVISPKNDEPPTWAFERTLRQQFAEYQGWILVND